MRGSVGSGALRNPSTKKNGRCFSAGALMVSTRSPLLVNDRRTKERSFNLLPSVSVGEREHVVIFSFIVRRPFMPPRDVLRPRGDCCCRFRLGRRSKGVGKGGGVYIKINVSGSAFCSLVLRTSKLSSDLVEKVPTEDIVMHAFSEFL